MKTLSAVFIPVFIPLFILGAISALSMAPLSFWPALFAGISGLYIFVIRSNSSMRAALCGLAFGLGYFSFSLSWIGNALLVEGNPYWWAWPLAVTGLPLILSIFTALACYTFKIIFKHQNNIFSYIGFTLILTIFEWLRGHILTGFPWNLYGYTWVNILEIAQVAALYDIYLLTLFTIFWAGSVGFLYESKYLIKQKAAIATVLLLSFLCCYAYGYQKLNAHPTKYNDDYEIIIVQPNIAQSEKWKQEKLADNFLTLIELSKYKSDNHTNKKAAYIIWPETAIGQGILSAQWAQNMISNMLRAYPYEAYLITGALRHNIKTGTYYNSIITINKDANIIHNYDKSHLVPFGEYMPLSQIFDIAPIVGFTGFKEGTGRTTHKLPEGLIYTPLVCYEIIFPKRNMKSLAPKPDFIINATNDAWYGYSAGPYQHLTQSIFRAIETNTPVFRAANTGISAIIDPMGRVIEKIQLFKEGNIKQKIPIIVSKPIQSNYTKNN